MNFLPGTQQIVDDTDSTVGVSGKPVRVYSIELISGGTASTIKLFNSTAISAAAQYAQVDGIANKSVVINYAGGKLFPNGCFCQTDANTTFVTIILSTEN